MEDLKKRFDRSGMSLGALAEAAGVSKTVASQVVNGKYQGAEETKAKVAEVLAPFAESGGITLTPGQKEAVTIFDLSREPGTFSIVCGTSGTGKTTIISKYKEDHPDTKVFQSRLGMTPVDVTRQLCSLLGVAYKGTEGERIDRIFEAAKDNFILVDEADLLMERRSSRQVERLVDMFRMLTDNGASVVLVGLPSLYEAVLRIGETYVFSRVAYYRRMTEPGREILGQTWADMIGEYPEAVGKTGPVVSDAMNRGSFRYLGKLAKCVQLADGDINMALGLMFRPGAEA